MLRYFVYFCFMISEIRYAVEAYGQQDAVLWDDFVSRSRNATFLLQRAYMDYHSDRFVDRSLLIYAVDDKQRKLVALFAACECAGGEISAHGGLTYGGLILPFSGGDGVAVVEIMSKIVTYYRLCGYKSIRYKAIPHIYHRYPCEEDVYALFRLGAHFVESNLSSAIDLTDSLRFNENSRRNVRRAADAGVKIERSADFSEFWQLLETLLAERYSTRPVHSLDEISLLASRFPDNIELLVARNEEGRVIAGSVLYKTETCLHAQYIAASPEGKRCGALPLLFNHAITERSGGVRYFDFGISNEDHGRYLNAGLLRQKNAMGGRGITYNIYELPL